jgi:hypothetical protein
MHIASTQTVCASERLHSRVSAWWRLSVTGSPCLRLTVMLWPLVRLPHVYDKAQYYGFLLNDTLLRMALMGLPSRPGWRSSTRILSQLASRTSWYKRCWGFAARSPPADVSKVSPSDSVSTHGNILKTWRAKPDLLQGWNAGRLVRPLNALLYLRLQ